MLVQICNFEFKFVCLMIGGMCGLWVCVCVCVSMPLHSLMVDVEYMRCIRSTCTIDCADGWRGRQENVIIFRRKLRLDYTHFCAYMYI